MRFFIRILLCIFLGSTTAFAQKVQSPGQKLKRLKIRLTGLMPSSLEFSEISKLQTDFEVDAYLDKKTDEYLASPYFNAQFSDNFLLNARMYPMISGQSQHKFRESLSMDLSYEQNVFTDFVYQNVNLNASFDNIYRNNLAGPITSLEELVRKVRMGQYSYFDEIRDRLILAGLSAPETNKIADIDYFKQYLGLGLMDPIFFEKPVKELNSALRSHSLPEVSAEKYKLGLAYLLKKRDRKSYAKISQLFMWAEESIGFSLKTQFSPSLIADLREGGVLNLFLQDPNVIETIYSFSKKVASNNLSEEVKDYSEEKRKLFSKLKAFIDNNEEKFGIARTGSYDKTTIFGRTFDQTIYSKAAALYRDMLCDNMLIQTNPDDDLLDNLVSSLSLNTSKKTTELDQQKTTIDVSHTKKECSSCHDKLDPVKEVLDSKRKQNLEIPFYNNFDSMDYINLLPGENLVAKLVSTDAYRRCQIQKVWNWMIGDDVPMRVEDSEKLLNVFKKSKGNIKEVTKAVISSDSFYQGFDVNLNLTFTDVKPIFTRCNTCHNEQDVMMGDLTKFPFQSLTGQSNSQTLYDILTEINLEGLGKNAKMPIGYHLAKADFVKIAHWISSGAKDSRGKTQIQSDSQAIELADKALKKIRELNYPKFGNSFHRLLTRKELFLSLERLNKGLLGSTSPFYNKGPFAWELYTSGRGASNCFSEQVSFRMFLGSYATFDRENHEFENQKIQPKFYDYLEACYGSIAPSKYEYGNLQELLGSLWEPVEELQVKYLGKEKALSSVLFSVLLLENKDARRDLIRLMIEEIIGKNILDPHTLEDEVSYIEELMMELDIAAMNNKLKKALVKIDPNYLEPVFPKMYSFIAYQVMLIPEFVRY